MSLGQIISLVVVSSILSVAAWMFIRKVRESPDAKPLTVKWIITAACFLLWIYLGIQAQDAGYGGAFIIPAIAAATGIILSILWTPHIASSLMSPITKWYDGGDEEPELKPLYSIATAYRKRGQYDKAVQEIRKQLARFPEDYEGYMMLAEVQAEDLKDLDTALQTIDHIATLPELAPNNLAYALTRAGDWQIKFRSDLGAARECFQRIIDCLPDTVQAQLAAQRIAHLASAEDLANMQDPKVIELKHYEEKIGLQGRVVAPPESDSPSERAQKLVEHLREFPLDNDAREKLAMIYAHEYERLDLATIELEQLIAAPNQIPRHVVHWLNLLADFQIKLAGDVNGARGSLERIISKFPNSAAANNAQTRLSQLRLELNQRSGQKTLKLGEYEQNIGLKRMKSSGTMES